MNDHDYPEALLVEAQRLRLKFLERELDLTQTFIELTRFESKIGNGDRVSDGIQHATHGLDTVRKFINLVSSPEERDRIAERLETLEAELAKLAV